MGGFAVGDRVDDNERDRSKERDDGHDSELVHSSTDTFLNAQMALMQQAFSAFVLLGGVFIKNVGDGFGNITPVTYIMSGGVPMKNPMAQSVAEGVPEQSLVEWDLVFGNNTRTIG